jgi:UDP:flavonoid glycosyltransferase YjiC (YdhE family)
MRQLRRRYGLPPARLDVRDAYTEADLTLYADLPDLVPMADLPGHHRFLGPVAWSPPVPLPPWWDGLRADRPVVYVNLGSSGPPALLPRVLTALADLPVQVVAATAGRPRPPAIPPNAQLADLLPGDAAARRASLVIGNGGSLSGYQALAAGRPVLGICTNLDQYLNMTGIQRAGAGWLLRSGRLSAAALRQAVRDALADDRALARAAELAAAIAGWPTAERFAAALAPAMAGPVGHH